MNAEKVRRAIREKYYPKLDELAASVQAGLLTVEEASVCAAGALLKIWDEAEWEPVSSVGKHDLALYNAKGDLALRFPG